jgi:hypothetical protein
MRMPADTGKPSNGSSVGFPSNLLQLTRRGRYITHAQKHINIRRKWTVARINGIKFHKLK